MDSFWQDLRYGARTLIKNPGFTVIAVLTLALGVGINTAMFSFVDAVLIKPLVYKDADRLVNVYETGTRGGRMMPSPPTFFEWRELNTVFSQVAAYRTFVDKVTLAAEDGAEQMRARFVSANYFDVLNVQAALGRTFRAGEDQPGQEQVVVISHSLWQQKFGGDPNVIGKTVRLSGKLFIITLRDGPYTIIGVLPAGSIFDRLENEIWLPLTIPPNSMRRNTQFFNVRARLRDGLTVAQADAEMKRLAANLQQQGQDPRKGYSVLIEPLRNSLVKTDLRNLLLLLMGAVLFILLIASVNIANLLLARSAARRKEVVIRVAVGASRWRLMRQLLTESVLLALLGGGAGILLANWFMKAFVFFMPPSTLPREADVSVDYRVLAFTFGLSLLTGMLFGLVPAWQATRINLHGILQEHSRAFSGSFSRNKSRSLLLVAEIALSFMLLIGAALMINSFARLMSVDPGFQTEKMLTFSVTLPENRFPQAQQVLSYQSTMLDRLRALPGVQSASVTDALPLGEGASGTMFLIPGQPEQKGNNARIRAIDTEYFKTMGMRLVKGRFFSAADAASNQSLVVINETLASKIWPNSDPIGEQLGFPPQSYMLSTPYSVIGVVADVKHEGLAANAALEIYVPFGQLTNEWINFATRSQRFVVRTSGDPLRLASTVREIAASLDRDQPLNDLRTMEQVVSASVAEPRFKTFLFGIFGSLALILAAIGIYGVISYTVTESTHEIGIRVALGAQRRDILKLVIGHGMLLAMIGVALGLAGALAVTRVMKTLLFNVSATDPLTFASVAVILVSAALLACYLPARRAMKVDPMVALRYE